jgi:hypothetical protein
MLTGMCGSRAGPLPCHRQIRGGVQLHLRRALIDAVHIDRLYLGRSRRSNSTGCNPTKEISSISSSAPAPSSGVTW